MINIDHAPKHDKHDMPVMIFPRPRKDDGNRRPGLPAFCAVYGCPPGCRTIGSDHRTVSGNGTVETVPIGPVGWRTMMINRPMDSKTNPQVFRVYCLGMLYPLTPYIDLIDRYGRYLRKKSVPIIQWFVGLSGEQFPQEGAKELTTGSPQTDDEARRCFGKVRWTVEWTPVLIVKNI